jgi:radical SAM superfamily enzyme YgiQ (UPF0313 family)
MNITFVMPKSSPGLLRVRFLRMPPLGLLTLASATPSSWDIRIVDENIEEPDYMPSDIVAISVTTAVARRAYSIADLYRSKGATVILGGVHPSSMPKEAIAHADSVVIGEADTIWKKVLSDFQQGKLKKFYKGVRPAGTEIPVIKRELVSRKYSFRNLVQSSRGCPNSCDFCAVSHYNGRLIRPRPIERVLEEARSFGGKKILDKYFLFADDNIMASPANAESLFKAIKPLELYWGSQASLNLAKNERLLRLAADSGCKVLFCGFESLSQKSLAETGKPYEAANYRMLARRIHDHGIAIEGSFIYGFDNDDKTVFRNTVDFCNEISLDLAQFTVLTPFPGTSLFQRLKAQNRIVTYDWSLYDAFHVVYQPKNISAAELQNGMLWSYDNFYSYPNIAKRALATRARIGFRNAMLMTVANFDFRKFRLI